MRLVQPGEAPRPSVQAWCLAEAQREAGGEVNTADKLREKAKFNRAQAAALRDAWGLTSTDLLPDEECAALLDLLADAYEVLSDVLTDERDPRVWSGLESRRESLIARIGEITK